MRTVKTDVAVRKHHQWLDKILIFFLPALYAKSAKLFTRKTLSVKHAFITWESCIKTCACGNFSKLVIQADLGSEYGSVPSISDIFCIYWNFSSVGRASKYVFFWHDDRRMVSEFDQWREILPSNMVAGLFAERLLGNKQSRMVERIGSIASARVYAVRTQLCQASRAYIAWQSLLENENNFAVQEFLDSKFYQTVIDKIFFFKILSQILHSQK